MLEPGVVPSFGAERAAALRALAERLLREAAAAATSGDVQPGDPASAADETRLLHELQVQHVELQLQNEQLEQSHTEMVSARDRYARLFHLAPVGVLEVAADGSLVEVNEAAARLLLDTPAELKASGLETRLALTSVPTWRALLVTATRVGQARAELHLARPAARSTTVHAEAALDTAAGTALVTLADISERAQANAEQREAALALASANRARNDFLSRMSHELRTPLNALLGFAQLALLDDVHPLVPAQRARVEHIERAGQQLLALVEASMDVAWVDPGRVDLRPQPLSVPPASEGLAARPLRRVLFIGRSAADREAVDAAVQSLPAVSLTTSPDGHAGIRTARILHADLVIVGPDLPDMGAAEVLQALRLQTHARAVCCVTLAAQTTPDIAQRWRSEGFQECWPRPLAADALRARLAALLS